MPFFPQIIAARTASLKKDPHSTRALGGKKQKTKSFLVIRSLCGIGTKEKGWLVGWLV